MQDARLYYPSTRQRSKQVKSGHINQKSVHYMKTLLGVVCDIPIRTLAQRNRFFFLTLFKFLSFFIKI